MGCSQGNRELLQATGAGEGRRSGVVPLPSGVVRQWPAQPLRQRT